MRVDSILITRGSLEIFSGFFIDLNFNENFKVSALILQDYYSLTEVNSIIHILLLKGTEVTGIIWVHNPTRNQSQVSTHIEDIEAIEYKIKEAEHDKERAIEKKDRYYEILYRGKIKGLLEAKPVLGIYSFEEYKLWNVINMKML